MNEEMGMKESIAHRSGMSSVLAEATEANAMGWETFM